MKCPCCNGTGRTQMVTLVKDVDFPCLECHGTGVVEQTNEEWFTSLSTEEKADKLTDFSFWLVPALPSEERRERIRKKLMEWLKEKHKE